MMQKKQAQKVGKNASSDVFGNFLGGESSPARGRAAPGSWRGVSVRSPKLSFTNKKNHTTTTKTKDKRRKMKNSHSRRRAERGGG